MKKTLLTLLTISLVCTGCGIADSNREELQVQDKLSSVRHIPYEEIKEKTVGSVTPDMSTEAPATPAPEVPSCAGATGVQTKNYTAHFVGGNEDFVAVYEGFTIVQKGSTVYFLSDTKKYMSTLGTRDILVNLWFGNEDLHELLSFYANLDYAWLTEKDSSLFYHGSIIEHDGDRITRVGDYTILYDEVELPDVTGCYEVEYFIIDDAIREVTE